MEYSDLTVTVASRVLAVQSNFNNDLIKMIRIITTILGLCVLVKSESVPFKPPISPLGPIAHPNVVAPVNPINPAAPLYPYTPGNNPLIPGYKNPYYNPGAAVPILSYSNERGIDGSYAYSFSTADGKQAQERGFLKDTFVDNNGEPQGTQVVEGSYAYISPEGTPIQVSYVADENGFRPSGVHIPADGKGVPLTPAGLRDPQAAYDPVYNRYTPHNYRNPYYGNYNPLLNPRPYDPQYPYDPQLNRNNFYRPWGLTKVATEEPKKKTD